MVIHAPQEEEVTSLREMEMKLRDPGQWFSLQNQQNQTKPKKGGHTPTEVTTSFPRRVVCFGLVWFGLVC